MTDLEILECCQSILDFLEENLTEEELNFHGFDTPMNKKMRSILKKHGFEKREGDKLMHTIPMAAFCLDMNQKYKIHDKLWDKEAREFFATNKSRDFLKQIMRDLKINIATE